MTLIINLIGPPAAGKSTFAAKYILEHPEYRYCTIDEYRITYKDEHLAWRAFANDIRNADPVIMESVGLSWRLADMFNTEEARHRSICTIAFIGTPEILHERLTSRQKRMVPGISFDRDEDLALDHAIEHIHRSIAPIDLIIDTTKISIEDLYKELSLYISIQRIEALVPKARREESYPLKLE